MSDLPPEIEAFMATAPPVEKQTSFQVKSSSGDNVYTVTAFDGKPPRCTCIAYNMNRNKQVKKLGLTGKHADVYGWCKHIDWVMSKHG